MVETAPYLGKYSKIITGHGWPGVVGFKLLHQHLARFEAIEFLGEVKLELPANESSFLYFAKQGPRNLLCLFTVPDDITGRPLKFYKFHADKICKLEEQTQYPSFGPDIDFATAPRATATYKYTNDAIVQTSGSKSRETPRAAFLSKYAETFRAMQKTLARTPSELEAKLTSEIYSALVASVKAALAEPKQEENAPAKPPVKPNIKSVKAKPPGATARDYRAARKRQLGAQALVSQSSESVFAKPIIPLGTKLNVTGIRIREDLIENRPWEITADYLEHNYKLKVQFDWDGRLIKISIKSNSERHFQFGRRSPTKPELPVSVYPAAEKDGLVNLPLKDFARFMSPLIEQLEVYAKTSMSGEAKSALKKLIATTRDLMKAEVRAR